MPGLSNLPLKAAYWKGEDDLAADFYLPCMERSVDYWRAVGYFRSSIFVLAWPALREFVGRGGRIRILCSQILAAADIEAIDAGYTEREAVADADLQQQIASMLRDEAMRAPTRVLAALVAQGTIDIKVALMQNHDAEFVRDRIFHSKLGLFADEHGNEVLFKGSMNETWNGLAPEGNLETVDVSASWLGTRDVERITLDKNTFNKLWDDQFPHVQVLPFPSVAREQLCQTADPEWEESLEVILKSTSRGERGSRAPVKAPPLHDHQQRGLDDWAAHDRQGILAFVTGGGKTYTAITAMREALAERGEPVVVVVPDRVLFDQWAKEISDTLSDLEPKILRAGAGWSNWREDLGRWTKAGLESPRIVLATVQTASKADFRDRLRGGEHLMLVADEVHRLGAPERRALLDESLFGPRLGLSATPERFGDPVGTDALMSYFRGVREPRYTLADATRDGVLAPYMYRAWTAQLTDDEMEGWSALAKEAARLRAQLKDGDTESSAYSRLQRVLRDRARIVKGAEAKVPLAVSILQAEYRAGQHWLVYCDDQVQMRALQAALFSVGIESLTFHSNMEGDRGQTLEHFTVRGGLLLAIKCLDEGVDIPVVSHALILASSKNPREFIQRRGRVLRQAAGKSHASLHDVVVVAPRYDDPDGEIDSDPVLAGELGRALEFAGGAMNPGAAGDLKRIVLEAGMKPDEILGFGDEYGDEEDEEAEE